MPGSQGYLPCDGCGLPASPEHIAERIRRLELATRFRPIHIDVLFVALAPASRPEDDFYGPPKSKGFFNSFLDVLEISSALGKAGPASNDDSVGLARLAEFQHRGFHLVFLSECPIPKDREAAEVTISRLGPTLIRRIRFNYKPKQIRFVGREMGTLTEVLKDAGLGALLPPGQRKELTAIYDRIEVTETRSKSEAGGGS